MKKLTKKIAAVALTGVILAGAFAGCSSGKTDESGSADDQKTFQIGICQLMQHDALDKATQGFRDKLKELGDANGYTFNIDYQNANNDSAACATIAQQFVSNDYDLIMANATAALQASATATAASKIPVVATSITDFGVALDIDMGSTDATGINVTGSNDLAPLDEQAQQILDLFPDTKKVGCIYCSSEPNSLFQVEGVRDALAESGVEATFYSFSDSNDIQAVAKKAAQESDVIYVPTDNTAASNGGVIDAACREEQVPIIAGEEGIFKNTNAVATLSISFYEIGEKAGEMAYDILVNGTDPSTMNIWQPTNVTPYYNKEMADLYGAKIPENYQTYDLSAEE